MVLPELRPRLIVVGLSSRELNGNGRNQADELESFASSPAIERLTDTGGWSGRIERALEDASALVRYRTILREPLRAFDDRLAPPRPEQMLHPFGVLQALRVFEGAEYRITPEFRTRMVRQVFNDFAIGPAELEALDELFHIAEQAGVEVAVVLLPITSDAVAMHPSGAEDVARFEAAVEEVTDGHQLIDLRASFVDTALFADPLHLNSGGRVEFSRALADALVG
jgi:hypothetical protein